MRDLPAAAARPGLADTIRARREEIVARWEAAVRRLPGVPAVEEPSLRDHVPELLEEIAALAQPGTEPPAGQAMARTTRRHALHRIAEGFSLEQVLAELDLLREALLEVYAEEGPLEPAGVHAITRAIHQAIAAAVERYTVRTRGEVRRASRERAEDRALLEALFDSAPVGLAFWDRDLRFARVNRWLADLNGLPVAAHLGRRASEVVPGVKDVASLETAWRRMLETGQPLLDVELEGETPAQPGVRRSWREHFFPVRIDGEMAGVGGVAVEVTQQKRAEEEVHFLAHASQVLAAALSPEAVVQAVAGLAVPRLGDFCSVVLLDGAGGAARVAALHTADPAQEELARRLCLRFQVDPAAPRGVARVFREGVPDFIPEVRPETLAQLSLPPGAAELSEVRRMRSYLAVPLQARERTLGALVLFCYQGARRYEAQDLELAEELARRGAVALDNARLYQQALAEARQRETVLAVVSHDLRNPLSAIFMAASRVRATAAPGPGGDRTRTSAETIRRAADRMKRLIDDLLDSVSIQAGRLSLRKQLEDPGALAREAAESFQAGAREKQLALDVQVRGPLPAVRCDKDRVLQVLSNLLGNALKVTPAGGRLSVEVERRGDEVVFAVHDTGPGIAPDLLPRLFEPYVRGEAGYRGTGLGLAIARGIVAAHGGRIWVDSRVGEGSTFSFALPAGEAGERPVATPPPILH